MRSGSYSVNPYEVLGVSQDASYAEIQAAYRQHALRWHPDRNPNDEYSSRMMQRVNAAWGILKDGESRAAYDRWERGGETGSGSGTRAQTPTHSTRAQTRTHSNSASGGGAHTPHQPPPRDVGSEASRVGLPADVDHRFAAFLFDTVFVLVLAIVPIFLLVDVDGTLLQAIYATVILGLSLLYFTILLAVWSTTLGKRIYGLQVVRKDGSKVGIGRALCRSLLYYLFILHLISLPFIAIRRDKRGLHDLICDTKVVYR